MSIEENNKEQVVEEAAESKTELLGNREAMAKALSQEREQVEAKVEAEAPTKTEVKAAVDADIEPPAEFSAKGKEAWKNKDIRGIQEEYKRVATSRLQELDRERSARTKAETEAKQAREYSDAIKPYIEDRLINEGVPKEKAALDAIKLAHALRTDKAAAKVELEKLGFKFAADDGTAQPIVDDSKIITLQERLERLERDKEAQIFQTTSQAFAKTFDSLTSLKTRTGDNVFPDLLDNSEKGIDLAKRVGSRTKQPEFQEMVARRFPEADFNVLVREAYIWEGGRVAGEPVQVSPKQNQQHIEKSRRAAASTPGRVVSKGGSDSLIGKLSNKAALKKAIELETEH